ncbi:MAG: hypothetical protein FD181_1329 [Prolixibacteraceae bacterium]|nr:MAG: hypothetical protein FD181_1329 [Prolixibacteraceae bacterium]
MLGGNVKMGMNGNRLFIIELKQKIVRIAQGFDHPLKTT